MKKTTFLLTTITLFLLSFLHAASTESDQLKVLKPITEIEGFYLFEGDKHGDFKGNIVAALSDGSAWKGHPADRNIMRQWEPGDSVHIEVRTTSYWFKREHKFLLYNHDKKESIRAMLVNYGDRAMKIAFASDAYPTSTEEVCYSEHDSEGNNIGRWCHEEPCDYKKRIILSDGNEKIISSSLSYFTTGTKVYIGFNDSKSFFIISGLEREAKWSWLEDPSTK